MGSDGVSCLSAGGAQKLCYVWYVMAEPRSMFGMFGGAQKLCYVWYVYIRVYLCYVQYISNIVIQIFDNI